MTSKLHMFGGLNHRLRHGAYLRNPHGIQKYAEMQMGKLLRKVTSKSASYRERNENLLVEKANLRLRERELEEKRQLDPGTFFSVKRRLWAENTLVVLMLLAAIFLNFVAVTAFVDGSEPLMSVVRWLLAIALAVVIMGVGLLATERLLESLFPDATPEIKHAPKGGGRGLALLWGGLLVLIEVAILGLAQVRAEQLAADEGRELLYIGFIVLSMLLPVAAGALRWDAIRFIDLYKATQALRSIESRMAQIDSMLRQTEEFESNYYKVKSIEYWDDINDFKTHKDLYNEKNGVSEDLTDHFARSYDSFQQKANQRYTADLRDVMAPSMRRVSSGGEGGGSKLRRSGGQPMPRSSMEGNASQDHEAEETENSYLNVQPVR